LVREEVWVRRLDQDVYYLPSLKTEGGLSRICGVRSQNETERSSQVSKERPQTSGWSCVGNLEKMARSCKKRNMHRRGELTGEGGLTYPQAKSWKKEKAGIGAHKKLPRRRGRKKG